MLRAGNQVEFLVDGEAHFAAFVEAVQRARSSIRLVQLLFEPNFVPVFGGGPPPASAPPQAPLVDELAAAGRRGVDVRVLLNENATIPDHVDEMRARFAAAGIPPGAVRGLPMSPDTLHAKMLVIDDREAFLIGPPFEQRFWDAPTHLPMDARRRTDRPLHDVSVRLAGPIVADVARLFALLWNEHAVAGTRVEPAPADGPRGPATVGLVTTIPPGRFSGEPDGSNSVLTAYLAAIQAAKRWIYLENQYFTNPTITQALRRALADNPALEVILVINRDVDIPTYIRWQKKRLRELGWPDHPRLGAFSLWTPVPRPDGLHARPIYVHSKVAVIDDAWATTGAANLDSVSLEHAEEFLFRIPPNVEANVVLHDGWGDAPRCDVVPPFRRRLFAEHLGPEGNRADEPPEGWLAVWRRVAERNAQALGKGDGFHGWALPHAAESPWLEVVASRGP